MSSSAKTDYRRAEDAVLLSGRGRFVDDLHLDRMTHAVFLRSPHAHARIRSINRDRAMAAGALAVFIAEDLDFAERRLIARYWHPSIRRVLPPFLAGERVRFVGEPIALVIAEDCYQAEDFAQLVDVDYEELPALGTPSAAMDACAVALHAEWPNNIAAQFQHKIGDAKSAIEVSDRKIKRNFSFRRQGGMPLETRGCVAEFDPHANMLTVWSSTQTHYAVRMNLAELLQLSEQNVRVITGHVGGGFGAKSRPYIEEIVVAHASRSIGRPVKWIEDRLEHMMATTQSRGIDTEIELGYDEEGIIQSLNARLTVDVGSYIHASGIITAEVAAAHCCGPYRIPNATVDVVCVGTNKVPLATCRGAGQPEATFPLECMIDLIAKDLRLSATEVRRRNLIRPSDMPFDPGIRYGGCVSAFESGDFPELLDRTIKESGYSEKPAFGQSGERIAWGLACGVESTGLINFESARVSVDTNGQVVVASGLTSQGQGQYTTLQRVCAETLGVDRSNVRVELGDTGLIKFGRGTFASRGAVMGGNAVLGAATALREKALRIAAQLLQVQAQSLDMREGVVFQGDAPTALRLNDLATAIQPGGPLHSGDMALEATYVYDSKNVITLALSIHAAKVSISEQTGACRVLDYFVMHDAGRMLDPIIVEGQIVGGAIEGIGCTLLSEFKFDESGQLLTGSLADYLLINAADAPRIRVGHMQTIPKTNLLGVRGVGEGGTIAAPPAIVNGIVRALNFTENGLEQELFALPIAPEALMKALQSIVSEKAGVIT